MGAFLVLALVGALVPEPDNDQTQGPVSTSTQPNEEPASATTQLNEEPVSATTNTTATAIADFASGQWEEALAELATTEDSLIARADEAARIGPRLTMDAGTAETELTNMVSRVRSGELVSMPAADEQWALANIVTARSIEAHYGQSSDRGQFAYDYFQIVRDLYRGTEAPTSDFILANIDQLNRAIDEGL